MKVQEIEFIGEVYQKIKEGTSTKQEETDAYYLLCKNNVLPEFRIEFIKKWVENFYVQEYKAAAELEQNRINRNKKR